MQMTAKDDDPAEADGPAPGMLRIYLGFLASAAGIILLLLLVGFEPTRRLAGQLAIPAMILGCLISLLAALVGTADQPRGPAGRGDPLRPPGPVSQLSFPRRIQA
jgi:hypothetical protein